jgi:hypothetical protein
MVGQLTLDQHIGVRIPGGQPKILKNLRLEIPSKELGGNNEVATFRLRVPRNAGNAGANSSLTACSAPLGSE